MDNPSSNDYCSYGHKGSNVQENLKNGTSASQTSLLASCDQTLVFEPRKMIIGYTTPLDFSIFLSMQAPSPSMTSSYSLVCLP